MFKRLSYGRFYDLTYQSLYSSEGKTTNKYKISSDDQFSRFEVSTIVG